MWVGGCGGMCIEASIILYLSMSLEMHKMACLLDLLYRYIFSDNHSFCLKYNAT